MLDAAAHHRRHRQATAQRPTASSGWPRLFVYLEKRENGEIEGLNNSPGRSWEAGGRGGPPSRCGLAPVQGPPRRLRWGGRSTCLLTSPPRSDGANDTNQPRFAYTERPQLVAAAEDGLAGPTRLSQHASPRERVKNSPCGAGTKAPCGVPWVVSGTELSA